MNHKFYTGVGSRDTPDEILTLMTVIARKAYSEGLWLWSGGAEGADTAFEQGAGDHKQIFLPWPGFGRKHGRIPHINDVPGPTEEAEAMAPLHHPAWDKCNESGRLLHSRNCHQVLGLSLKCRTSGLICWTRRGKIVGGTGQALRIATDYSVPVLNLAIPKDLDEVLRWLKAA